MTPSEISLVKELLTLRGSLRHASLAERRDRYEQAQRSFGRGLPAGEVVDAGGCVAEWVLRQRDAAQPILIYVHGGGYCLGSPGSHRHLAAAIGEASNAAVLSLNYRRAPEHPFPAAALEVAAAARWMLQRSSAPILLAGDSAGGGLVVSTMISLRDSGSRLPAAGICLSPWVDLTCSAQAYETRAHRDPLLSPADLRMMASLYLGRSDPRDPVASPALGDLDGLPPLLIQVGTEEILLDDAKLLADAAEAAGVSVTLELWQEMIHVWHWYFHLLSEGRQAIAAIGKFARRQVGSQPRPAHAPPRLTDSQPSPWRSGLAPRACASQIGGQGVTERCRRATPIQEAHLLIAPSTAGRGFLSWVYQLNGHLDCDALRSAIDEVTERHEILRAKFERRDEELHQVIAPHEPGTLAVLDLRAMGKRDAIEAAVADAQRTLRSLSPHSQGQLRAMLYMIDRKTFVFAMFVAEALLDSDSGELLCAEITRAYASQIGEQAPQSLPAVSAVSCLDLPPEADATPSTLATSAKHWARQAAEEPPSQRWWEGASGLAEAVAGPVAEGHARHRLGSRHAFQLSPQEWARVEASACALRTTPYVLILSCLQMSLVQVAGLCRLLVHVVVPRRGANAAGVLGNFHSIARLIASCGEAESLPAVVARSAAAVAEAIEHAIVPAPLKAPGSLTLLRSKGPLPETRLHMFSSHEGPRFAGVRRRRFRLHDGAAAPLSVTCVRRPDGAEDFVLSSTTAPQESLDRLAGTLQEVVISLAPEGLSPVPPAPPALMRSGAL